MTMPYPKTGGQDFSALLKLLRGTATLRSGIKKTIAEAAPQPIPSSHPDQDLTVGQPAGLGTESSMLLQSIAQKQQPLTKEQALIKAAARRRAAVLKQGGVSNAR